MKQRLRFSSLVRTGVALCMAAHLGAALAQTAAAPLQTLRILGGLAGVNQYSRNEEPFWTQELRRLTDGKYAAEIVPFDRAGVPGPELLRLMQFGVVPFGTALLSNVSTQNPDLAASDLAGLNPDLATLKKNLSAFRPYLEKTLRERHGVELLAIYTYPAQVIFCKTALAGLGDLAGRRVRVSSATQADFVTALNAHPVLLSFAQVAPNLASGNTECAITGSMSGNTLGLHALTSHMYAMPITWGLALFGANLSAWRSLPSDLRATLSKELPKLEAAIWTESERETAEGFACNRGLASCTTGRKGAMTEVATSAADEKRRQELLVSTVLPRWLQRCKLRCAEVWNQTLGASSGITLPPSP
ncbi:MAG: TRAP transporter substrate-binding protein [Rhodoferax sp.]|nr:TRAP transporter substrate-binding protein [Rhodoferax sp.]MCF8209547.1 TRAP transporter substrate-binding protein [Rhodoferax sp.]